MTKFYKKEGTGGGDNSLYVRFKPNEPVRGVVAGDPYEFFIKFGAKGSGAKPTESRTRDSSEFKERYRINFIQAENGAYKAKILEFGPMIWNELLQLQDSGYVLDETVVQITQVKSGDKTNYSVLVPPKSELGPEKILALKAVPLNQLAPGHKVTSPVFTPVVSNTHNEKFDSHFDESDIPF